VWLTLIFGTSVTNGAQTQSSVFLGTKRLLHFIFSVEKNKKIQSTESKKNIF